MFSCEFCEISKKTFLKEHLWATASATINSGKLLYHFSHIKLANRPTKIFLKKNDKIFSKDYEVAEGLSSFSGNAVKALNVKPKDFTLGDTSSLSNPAEFAIKKSHPSILNTKENVPVDHLFQFEHCQVS